MSDQTLRSGLIRLAHAKPELRPVLLPLLSGTGKQAAGQPNYADLTKRLLLLLGAMSPPQSKMVEAVSQTLQAWATTNGLDVRHNLKEIAEDLLYNAYRPGKPIVDARQVLRVMQEQYPTAFTSRVAAAAPLFTEAEQILHDVAALAASQLGGKVRDVSGFGLSGIYDSDGNPKTNYASGSASVNLPKLPDFRAAGTATLEIQVSADTDNGTVDVMVYVSGTIKTVDAAFTKVMRDKQLSGAPDQVRSKLRGWMNTIRTVLEGDFVRGAAVQQALPALKKAEADLKQMLDGVTARLGGELAHLHQSHPARLVGEVVVETVSVGISGLLSVPDRMAAREAYATARQALVKACKSFRSGDMRAMVSSQTGYWSSYELEMYLHIYQGDTAPVVSRVAAAGIPVTLKKKLSLKDGTVIEAGEKGTLRFNEQTPRQAVVDFDVRPNTKLGCRLLGDYFGRPFMKEPSMKALENMGDGIAKSVTGKKVEPDGYGPDGSPSWLLALGMI